MVFVHPERADFSCNGFSRQKSDNVLFYRSALCTSRREMGVLEVLLSGTYLSTIRATAMARFFIFFDCYPLENFLFLDGILLAILIAAMLWAA